MLKGVENLQQEVSVAFRIHEAQKNAHKTRKKSNEKHAKKDNQNDAAAVRIKVLSSWLLYKNKIEMRLQRQREEKYQK